VAYRLGRSTQRVESAIDLQKQSGVQTAAAITELKADIAALRAVLTEVALQKAEIERLHDTIARLEKWYDELRRGEGFVYPLESKLKQRP
jgi:acyl carrier protein phosphodiesterase